MPRRTCQAGLQGPHACPRRTSLEGILAQLAVHCLIRLEEHVFSDAAAIERAAHVRQRAAVPRPDLQHGACKPACARHRRAALLSLLADCQCLILAFGPATLLQGTVDVF